MKCKKRVEEYSMLNKDEIYLICKKLNLRSLRKFCLVNKHVYNIIFLHKTLLVDKLICPAKTLRVLIFQINLKLNFLCDEISSLKRERFLP